MDRQSPLLTATAILLALLGLAFVGGGVWLVALGGTWYYLAAGAALLLSAARLDASESSALGIFGGVLAATLVWSLFEVGLDWWSIAAPGDVLFVVGLLLWTPWIGRCLADRAVPAVSPSRPPSRAKRYRRTLGLVLQTYAVVTLASWYVDTTSTEDNGLPKQHVPAALSLASPVAVTEDREWPVSGPPERASGRRLSSVISSDRRGSRLAAARSDGASHAP